MRSQRPIERERGETLVEFALSLVLFLMTIFGTLEFGRGVWMYNMVSNLAQEGARRASVCGSNSGLPTSDCNITNFLHTRDGGLNVTATTSPGSLSGLTAGSTVSVTVSKTFQPLTGIVPNAAINLESTATMIVAR